MEIALAQNRSEWRSRAYSKQGPPKFRVPKYLFPDPGIRVESGNFRENPGIEFGFLLAENHRNEGHFNTEPT
jgi:hypothetical protein